MGAYKDMGNTNKPLTPAEKKILMSQVKMDYDLFVQMVADGRHMSTTTVTKLSDGTSVTGPVALADGLIDKLGNVDDVRDYLSQRLGRPAVICGIDN